jgi:hypothetical protein
MKILFFSPAADIWEHSFPEALVAEMLIGKGLTITMARCRGVLAPLCPAGQAAGFTIDTPIAIQRRLCRRCNEKADLIDQELSLNHVEIDDFVAESDEAVISELLEHANGIRIELKLAEDFDRLCVDGQAIGRTALYEWILRHKKNDFEFSDALWLEYLAFLSLAARVTLISKRLLSAESPDRVITYNSLYVPHRAFSVQAKGAGLDPYFMHAGTNLARQHGTLMIGRDFTWAHLIALKERYEQCRDQPISKVAIDDVTEHFLCLFSAKSSFVYSVARAQEHVDIRAHFGVRQDQKLIVACTSSYDERFAVEAVNAATSPPSLLFARILDWVAFLIEQAVERPDWFILIRVHPREFPNRRERVQSEHSRKMQVLLQHLPLNVSVNWPDDNLSLYDLAQEADVFLNAWSSIGKEMALLGLPVVIYAPELVLYPPTLNHLGTTKEQYLTAIDAAIVEGWSFERCKDAFRWYSLEFSRSCVDMRSSFAPERRYRLGLIARAMLRVVRVLVRLPQERWDLMRRKRMPVATDLVYELFTLGLECSQQVQNQARFLGSADEEDMAIRSSLGRLGEHLFAVNPIDQPSKLFRVFRAAGLTSKRNIGLEKQGEAI